MTLIKPVETRTRITHYYSYDTEEFQKLLGYKGLLWKVEVTSGHIFVESYEQNDIGGSEDAKTG